MFSVAVTSFDVRRLDAAFERKGFVKYSKKTLDIFLRSQKNRGSKAESYEKENTFSSRCIFSGFIAGSMRYPVCFGTSATGRAV